MTKLQEVFFNDFVRLKRGYDLPNDKIVDGKYPVVASTSIKAFHKEYKVLPPSVVTGRSGSLGDVQFIDTPCWPLNTALYVKNFNKNNPKYVYYFLKMMHLENFNSGAGVPTLNQNHLHKLKIKIHSKEEQQQIAEILSAYDDLIETNNQRIATLEQLAQQIYKEWFVRMRFPGWENTAFEHGIPEGWEIENFDKFCMLQRGFDLPDQEIKNGIYPVMASTSIKAFHNTYKVEPPVITTGRSGSLGTVLFSHQKAWPLNTALFVKNFYGNSPYLVFYTLKILKLESFNAGAGVPSLNRNHLRGIKIKVPSKEIQNQFDKIISDIFNQKVVLEESNSILEKTRNLLLPRLISGKLSIKQAEALTP